MKTNNVYYSVKTRSRDGQVSYSDGGPYSCVSAALYAISNVAKQVEDRGGEVIGCKTEFGAFSETTMDELRGNPFTALRAAARNAWQEHFNKCQNNGTYKTLFALLPAGMSPNDYILTSSREWQLRWMEENFARFTGEASSDKYGCPNCLSEGFIDAPCSACGHPANPALP